MQSFSLVFSEFPLEALMHDAAFGGEMFQPGHFNLF